MSPPFAFKLFRSKLQSRLGLSYYTAGAIKPGRLVAMDEEDAGSNSSDSPVDCNSLEWPYINAPSVFEGTSAHTTTSSDESLEQDQFELADEFMPPGMFENPDEIAYFQLKEEYCGNVLKHVQRTR